MSDLGNGVYVSFRTPEGALFSSSRETWAEAKADLIEMFGPEWVDAQVSSIVGVYTNNVVPLVPQDEAAQAEAIAEAFDGETLADTPLPSGDTPEQGVQQPPASTFTACEKCGATKDRWVPPGISKKSGKKYPGFYGCSNKNCR